VSPASGSTATTAAPTSVPGPLCSGTLRGMVVAPSSSTCHTGGSFTLVSCTTTVPVLVRPVPSVARTVSVNSGKISKSSTSLEATVSCPLLVPMAKVPPWLPRVMVNEMVSPASGSVASTVPTTVPTALFSGTENCWLGMTKGGSGASVTVTVMVHWPPFTGCPLSVTSTSSWCEGPVSWSSAPDTRISPDSGEMVNRGSSSWKVSVNVWPTSGSDRATVPTTVPTEAASDTLSVALVHEGASFTSVTWITTAAVPSPPWPSWATTVTSNQLGSAS